jgi:hypothetical protein
VNSELALVKKRLQFSVQLATRIYITALQTRQSHFIAHLAETPFGFSTSTLLPITPQTPKHLGFGVIMPFRVRRDTPFALKTPASWRNGFFDSELFDLRYPANGFFNFQWSYFSAVQVKTNAL